MKNTADKFDKEKTDLELADLNKNYTFIQTKEGVIGVPRDSGLNKLEYRANLY